MLERVVAHDVEIDHCTERYCFSTAVFSFSREYRLQSRANLRYPTVLITNEFDVVPDTYIGTIGRCHLPASLTTSKLTAEHWQQSYI